jgi:hypothetical protein
MTVEITIQVPDDLGQELQQVRDRLPEVLARGLREVLAERFDVYGDEQHVIEVLASQPTPEEILALHPTPALQERVSNLLRRNKHEGLTVEERAELDRYLVLEHLVRVAKARAFERLRHST